MHTRTGNFREHKSFHSHHLPDDRGIIVYLPPDYGIDESRRYPVLYLHDGQNVFDEEAAFPGVRRIDEYTRSRDSHRHSGGQEAEKSVEDTRLPRDILKARGWVIGHDPAYTEARDAGHNEEAWAARLRPMLESLFA